MISIIIPVYKAEEYFDECVLSILSQTYKDFELLLVDDGSPDSCPKKCDNWAKVDKRVKVIHKSNGGVSSARNVGIEASTGEYLCFVDSDDILPPNSLYLLVQDIKCHDADMVIGAFTFLYGKKLIHHSSRLKAGKYLFSDIMSYLLDDGTLSGFLLGSVWGGLYRKSIIQQYNIRFLNGLKNNEDGLFNFEYALVARSLYVIGDHVYLYRQDQPSYKPKRHKENFGEKVFEVLDSKEWPKAEFHYNIQKSRRYVTLAWWDILHSANDYSFLKFIVFIRKILSQENVLLGMKYMCPKKMNRYKKMMYFIMKYRMNILCGIVVKYAIPVMQKRLSR